MWLQLCKVKRTRNICNVIQPLIYLFSYRWNLFKVIPLASTVRTRNVLPNYSDTFDVGDAWHGTIR